MIERVEYLDKVKLFLDKPVIKILSGMRRVGKSTILSMVAGDLKKRGISEKNIIFINKEMLNFEFIRDYKVLYKYVKDFLSKSKKKQNRYIFIDEVQEIIGWEKAVASFLAEEIGDIVLTGSNAHMLSSDLATLLTGRYVEIPVYPISFKEFYLYKKRSEPDINSEETFQLYLKYGGLPGIHFLPPRDEAIYPYLSAVTDTVLLKDVVRRYNIRDVSTLEKIVAFVFDNCGNVTTAKSITDYFKSQKLKVTVDTVQNYLQYLCNVFLLYKLKRFDLKGKRYLDFHDKYYLLDVGLKNSLLGYRDNDISGLLENIVLIELLRRGFKVSFGTLSGLEIDFIAQNQTDRMYVQVAYLLLDKKTEEREFGNLEKISDNYPKLVLSMDKFHGSGRKGILRKNIIDFLLE